MAHHAKSLPSLLNDLIEDQATNEPARYRQRLDTLLSRFKQLCISSEETSHYCTIIIKAKMIHENTLQLNTSLGNISNTSIQFRDVADVRNALQEQIHICENLQKFSQQVNELVARGNELIRQPSVPKYVQQDIQNIQKVYNEKTQSANDLLGKLKVKKTIEFNLIFWMFVFTSVYLNFGNVLMEIDVVINNKLND
jgi:hypothetical protein